MYQYKIHIHGYKDLVYRKGIRMRMFRAGRRGIPYRAIKKLRRVR